ncbi:MAG: flagellar hook assembly protein FlgD [Pseudomonadota bacterium]
MSDVTAVGGPAQPTLPVAEPVRTDGTGTTQTLDYDAYLRLLVTQLQNQDPLEPMESTEYVAQLATFSNVEQGIITNEKLDALLSSQALNGAEGLIGRTVTAFDGTSGEVTSVSITSAGTVAILADGTRVPMGEGVTIA